MAGTTVCSGNCARARPSRRRHWALAAVTMAALSAAGAAAAFDTDRADFSVRIHGVTIPYRVFAVYVLPGESLDVAISPGNRPGPYRVRSNGRSVVPVSPGHWRWRAPSSPEVTELDIDDGRDTMRLNVIVMHPANEVHAGRLRAYRIGYYPARPLHDNPIYSPPGGFVQLDARDASLQLSPHFRLRQFPAKEAGGPPKFLVLRERLLLKLELLLDALNAAGRHADTFTIMSGYRTPSYNAALGNVEYSRHVYGGAADIYVDSSPRDGIMDDLNRDGVTDYRDAQWLYRLANRLFSTSRHRELAGGLGVYRSTSAHGPFVHMDARGTRARWGLIP